MKPCDLSPWQQHVAARLRCEQNGRICTIEREKDERVTRFETDTPAFRVQFGNQQSCDAAYFLESTESRSLVFVELKGANVEEALPQLGATLRAVQPSLPAQCAASTRQLAVVIARRGLPSQTGRELARRFQKATGVELRQRSSPTSKPFDLRGLIG